MFKSLQVYMQVRKYSGELIPFQEDKLRNSLCKSGASDEQVDRVVLYIKNHLFNGITTKEVYEVAFRKLKEINNSVAARYSLKKALRDLGPAGYYFEKWISKFFKNYSYQIMHGQIIKGKAVKHEADVIAQKGDELYWVECKFRNTVDAKVSVTTPMYLLSRVKDISGIDHKLFGSKRQFTKGLLVTNAYFTADSIAFGEFYNLKLLSWDYPQGNSIKNLVDQKALYPITCLTSLTDLEKQAFMEKDIFMVKELKENSQIVNLLVKDVARQKEILLEIEGLLQIS